jgi:transposase-like protein
LQKRGLALFVHDGSAGLAQALELVHFGARVEQQRCIFHKLQNVRREVVGAGLSARERQRRRREVLAAASAVYRGESESEIRGRLARFREEWGKREPGAVATLEREFDQTLVYLRVLGRARESGEEWREECLRTTSPLEGVQRHLRQKVRQMVIGHSQPGLEAAIYLVIRHHRLVAGQEAADWAAQLEEALLAA